ncbi:cysteine desulfurase family protein [Nesterenkonia alkaliphila]|uniref:Aminotransferase class V-fold PLP-dependent enzyme n=1 Tax=Nesterenkonia alkaliphila TaxID=1463631 RepID=A0A7K1UK60_9MICC|nr:cysteine desulfurase family protein [Nesterenkonia alkaliphila]MVT26878.1 aminotransferase class V-fold PLP-dependent enzyme [Nesterenkonia alkaliphila]GFZ82236.1 cysteine desulfurase [Nesterenkonia alkaliphila]
MSRYFDHAATTPVKPAAVRVLTELLPALANPSSLHGSGRRARLAVDSARAQLAAAVGADPSEVIFTSGGTEADNLGLKGLYWQRSAEDARRRRVLLPGIEHHAVLETAEWLESHEQAELVMIPVDGEGVVDLPSLSALLADEPETIALATVMWANNEVGAVQPVAEIGRLCAQAGVPLHTDAVQAFGSVPVSFRDSGAATMAISGHKLGAPVGVGALLVRREVKLTPVLHGGGQERDIRSGTLDAPGVCAFAAVAEEVAAGRQTEAVRLAGLRDQLLEAVTGLDGVTLRGPDPREHPELRLPNNLHITVEGAEGDSLLFMLDMAGFDTATGSACTAGVPRPSHVLMAMGLSEAAARGAQRFTLGWTTTEEDVAALADALPGIIAQSRQAGLAAQRRADAG